ncbi:MAG: M20/M25/M40 family metallo-hydrolase [Myxococcota bacterium]
MKTSKQDISDWAVDNLTRVIAIDSQSDETSKEIPSTEGQRRLSDDLRAYFSALGFRCEQDQSANLLVTVPGRGCGVERPPLALMVHIDTAQGTAAVASLCEVPSWDGQAIPYPDNPRLEVSVDTFPELQPYRGQDILHGPGVSPVGFDDKIGVAELMTLARVLAENPELDTPELVLVFRPDEEIGRMEAVVSVADVLAKRGVTHGYTIDGLAPFEINTENFNASQAELRIAGEPLEYGDATELTLNVLGCKSHGATAKAEGYLNATVILARLLPELDRRRVVPVRFVTDLDSEVNAKVTWLLLDSDPAERSKSEERLLSKLNAQLEPHRYKGAAIEVIERTPFAKAGRNNAVERALGFVRAMLEGESPTPVLSEDSDGFEGYSNPYAIEPIDGGAKLSVRIRDFRPTGLADREEHVRRIASGRGELQIESQYVNMGPVLAKSPELVRWAESALEPLGVTAAHLPIRGGTGVDPFLERGIPVANLGTGYFAPESEKELTSRQNIASTVLWLTELVRQVALG